MRRLLVGAFLVANVVFDAAGAAPLKVQLSLSPSEMLPGLPISMRVSVTNVSSVPVSIIDLVTMTVEDAAGVQRTAEFSWPGQFWEPPRFSPYVIDPGSTLELLAPVDVLLYYSSFFFYEDLGLWQPGDYRLKVKVMTAEGQPGSSNTAFLRVVLPGAEDSAIWRSISNNGTSAFASYNLFDNFKVIASYPESEYYRHFAPFVNNLHYVAKVGRHDLDGYATHLMRDVQGLTGAYVDAARFSVAWQYREVARRFSERNDQVAAAKWSAKGRVYAQQLIDSPGSPHGALLGPPLKALLHTRKEWEAEFARESPGYVKLRLRTKIAARLRPAVRKARPRIEQPKIVRPRLASVVLSNVRVPGARTVSGTVTLDAVVPVGGVTLTISSNAAVARVRRKNVRIGAGATSAEFQIETSPVVADRVVTISATGAGRRRRAVLRIESPRIESLTLIPSTVIGGEIAEAWVTLTGPAPAGGFTLRLASDRSEATVQPGVTINAGAATASFVVSTKATTQTVGALIEATSRRGRAKSVLTIEP